MSSDTRLKVMCLTRYGRLGASTRLRTLQFLPALREQGIDPTVVPLFSDRYVQWLYERRIDWRSVLSGYANRVRALLGQADFDVVWLEKEALPWIPWSIESALGFRRAPMVVDYDDAVFHYYDLNRRKVVRTLLHDKIDRVMASASAVSAGNPYLADRAQRAGARRIEIIPTVVDLDRYQLQPASQSRDVTRIGWIGTPGTAPLLRVIEGPLAKITCDQRVELTLVGVRTSPIPSVPIEPRPWAEETEVSEIQRFDVGIMPLPDEPFERGKCGYKLIQYMACGLPVVASPVGVNQDIVQHGINGFLASDPDEWLAALARLVADPGLRARMGSAGRRLVEERYSLTVTAPRIAELLRSAARG